MGFKLCLYCVFLLLFVFCICISCSLAQTTNTLPEKHIVVFFCGGGIATKEACKSDREKIENYLKYNWQKGLYDKDIQLEVVGFYPNSKIGPLSRYSEKYINTTIKDTLKKIANKPENNRAVYHFLVNSLGFVPFKKIYEKNKSGYRGLSELGIRQLGTIIFNQCATNEAFVQHTLEFVKLEGKSKVEILKFDSQIKPDYFINLLPPSDKTKNLYGIIQYENINDIQLYEKEIPIWRRDWVKDRDHQPKLDESGNTIWSGPAYVPGGGDKEHATAVMVGIYQFGDIWWASLLDESNRQKGRVTNLVGERLETLVSRQKKIIDYIQKTTLSEHQIKKIESTHRPALPGDLIVRHGKNILGPPLLTLPLTGINKMTSNRIQLEDIPHIGILLDNGQAFDLKNEKVGVKAHGIIYKSKWDDVSRFKNPGFFSVLESNIPIKFNEKLTTFRDLPNEVKSEVREKVCSIAENYIGKDVGEYTAVSHCGDATIKVYDEALTEIGISVQRYKGPFAFTKVLPGMKNKGLVDGKLRDWFVNDWFTGGKIMDPSEANDKLPRVGLPESNTIKKNYKSDTDLGGIDINPQPIEKNTGLIKKKDEIMNLRPSKDSLYWTN